MKKEQLQLQKELAEANEKLRDIVNAIPGGVAIYKASDIFKTVYFSDGVPDLTGYTIEEYQEIIKEDAADLIYEEDKDKVVAKAREVIAGRGVADTEFRKLHRDGHIVWVRAQIKYIGEEDGCPLLHCVFHNISDLKTTQLEMEHLINFIPGGIASYLVEETRFVPIYFSDGVMAISGHTREEYEELVKDDALCIIYEQDRERVFESARDAVSSGEVLDISYRMRHKNGNLIWIHLNGRRMGPRAEKMWFYAVFTGMSAETRLYQNIVNETADGIYVIEQGSYDVLYAKESGKLFGGRQAQVGQKCYALLYGEQAPCSFCTLGMSKSAENETEIEDRQSGQFYKIRSREIDWNGIPAYMIFVHDITEEVRTRKEKEKLEQYFQTVLRYLPGGIVVLQYKRDGRMVPEFISEGFASLTEMSQEDTWNLYREDAMTGTHPDDREFVLNQLEKYMESNDGSLEMVYRLQKGSGGYIWVKNSLSLIKNENGEGHIYCVYNDMTKELEEQNRLRQQYRDLIMKHYHDRDANTLILGHCNITQNKIYEINDYTGSDLLNKFGTVREEFFTGLSALVTDEKDREEFLGKYLSRPALEAYQSGCEEQNMECFVRFPRDEWGRYVKIKMHLVSTPDGNDVTGILTVTDITEQVLSDKILHQLSAKGYDFVADTNLFSDSYQLLSYNERDSFLPPKKGEHSKWVTQVASTRVVPRDRVRYLEGFDKEYMLERLKKEKSYTFTFSIIDNNGEVRTKSMTVSAVDLRLGRVCFARADITESIREQQGLLHVIAYTFELAGFVSIESGSLTMYTRETVLEDKPPYFEDDYDVSISWFIRNYGTGDNPEELLQQFKMANVKKRLEEKPEGYDFVFLYKGNDGERYKQVNVLWGDANHRTICMVRADVTDMLMAERQTKKALENALILAEKANRAKSDFLSAMSHDIRTPMNAIMGMTALAKAHMGEWEKVSDYLQKISISSRHLLSLINDILDMSKIECAQITLNRMKIYLPEQLEQLKAIIAQQAEKSGLRFEINTEGISHEYFYGDALRLNQILINILSNAVKYTPEGGCVIFSAEELSPMKNEKFVCYRFTISDTGVGMSEEFLTHIFEPFIRSKNESRVEGTGLGLSITKGLVDLMGGDIEVSSQQGIGSRFQVTIECEPAAADILEGNCTEKISGEGGEDSIFAGRRFLVAEDNAINAEILCELLSMYGAKTVLKTDGLEAVKAFRESRPGAYDAILMDIQMPKMDGYEATRAIRNLNHPSADIPIVAMTANAFAEDVKAAEEAGMNAHVAKPIDIKVLRETMKRVLENHR